MGFPMNRRKPIPPPPSRKAILPPPSPKAPPFAKACVREARWHEECMLNAAKRQRFGEASVHRAHAGAFWVSALVSLLEDPEKLR